jgi:hypothetical protein
MVRVIAPIDERRPPRASEDAVQQFARAIFPVVSRYLPR